MHHSGPYWLPPRRAPFGRRAGQPSERAPTHTALSPWASKCSTSPLALLGKESHERGVQPEPEHRVSRSFPPRGHAAMARKRGTKLLVVAAEACGAVFGQTGTTPRRVVRLPTADSLCDRMERGEEEANTGRCGAYPITIFEDVKARRL